MDEIERIQTRNLVDYVANERELNALFDDFKRTTSTGENMLLVDLKKRLFKSGFCAYICKRECKTFMTSYVFGFGLLISAPDYFTERYDVTRDK